MAFQQGMTARSDFDGTPERDVLAGTAVLVVEDDDLSREALELLLSHYGARVVAAASVGEAVRAFEQESPALVISDIALPDADGFGLIRHIRRRDAEFHRWTPAIAVSGMSPLDGDDPRQAGFDDFLLKPVDVEVLLARVRSLVATSHHS